MAAPAYRDLSAQKVVASAAASAPAVKAVDRRFVSAESPSTEVPAAPAELRLIVAQDLRLDGHTQMRAARAPAAADKTAPGATAAGGWGPFPADVLAAMDPAVIGDYSEIMTAAGGWGPFPPCEAVFDGVDLWLWRGFHRLAAFLTSAEAGNWSPAVPVLVRNGSLREAVLLAAADNADHGLRRSVADKRNTVDRLLADPEWGAWSDGKIARACRVSAPFVAARRQILAASAIVSGSLGTVPAGERKYTDRYGNDRSMNTGSITQGNKDRAAARAAGAQASAAAHGVGAKLGTCAVCGRPLSDPDHAARGCGPVCAGKLAAAGMAQSGAGLEIEEGAPAGQAAVAASDWAPASGSLRGRLLGIVDDLADYVQATGDTAGAEALRRACLAAAERLAAAGV